MGIEDLDLDLGEFADKVLVIAGEKQMADSICKILEMRSYQWDHAETLDAAKETATATRFDLIIVDLHTADMPARDFVDYATLEPGFRQASLLVLSDCQDIAELTEQDGFEGNNVVVIPSSPIDASTLLVNVATLLRRRKTKEDQFRLESQLLSQNAQLRDLTNRVKKELKQAQDLQQALMPKSLPKNEHCIFAATYVPLEAVGGDLFDIWQIGDDSYGLFIGDVTGHGLSAAFIGAMTKMALSYASKERASTMLAEMNNGISEHVPPGTFVTAAAAVYHPKEGKIHIARAGHPPPYVWRAKSGDVEYIEPGGLPLGVIPDSEYDEEEVTVKPGDKFLMITDGLCEAIDMNGEMLGIPGVGDQFARAAAKMGISDCVRSVYTDLMQFTGERTLKDDITLIGFEHRSGS